MVGKGGPRLDWIIKLGAWREVDLSHAMRAVMLGGWTWLFLLSLPSHSDSYSRGAPDTACTNKMIPRHGFDIQAGPPPAEILVDERAISHLDYLRVTIRTTAGPFKGFLVKAVEVVDTESPGGNGEWPLVDLSDNMISYYGLDQTNYTKSLT